MHRWREGKYETATPEGFCSTRGFVYHGLGIEPVEDDDCGVWHTDWDVTHVASGALVCTIVGLDEAEAFKLATILAELTRWASVLTLDELAHGSPELIGQLLLLSDLFGGSLAIRGLPSAPLVAPKPYWAAK